MCLTAVAFVFLMEEQCCGNSSFVDIEINDLDLNV